MNEGHAMNLRTRKVTAIARAMAAAVVVVVALPAAAAASPASGHGTAPFRPVCGQTAPGAARCFTVVATTAQRSVRGSAPAGYGATDLEGAYGLPISQGAGQRIAVVDATDDPTAEADLAVYRSTFGLPPCTTAGGCFAKLNQRGHAGPYPPADPGWDVEISLDLDMVSAACPLCHIVLVEANTPFVSDLGRAENTAAALGVAAISNSYGLQEFNGMQRLAHAYVHPGTTILASTGDFGFGPANFPAVLSSVVAVGGTTLTAGGGARGWSETAWSGAGSGCSAYISKPAWQTDRHCQMRTVADVSADADPTPGLAVYDTSIPPGFGLNPGWIVVGGTSASSPFVAGVVGLAGNGSSLTNAFIYQHRHDLYDAVGGSNGFCGGDYLCDGVKGYDGPTGLGTPHGSSGF
jgi:subtilase family serine protease